MKDNPITASNPDELASQTPPDNLTAALEYAMHGWPVFPVAYGGKHPLTEHGFHDATQDEDIIRGWGRKYSRFNPAIRTGKESNLLILDVDPDKGGDDSLIRLQEQYGPLPDTLWCATGGDGRHFYFLYPGPVRVRPKVPGYAGLDIKGDGGYVVAPPSMHASGNTYRWEVDWRTTPLASVPDWLLGLIQKEKGGPGPRQERKRKPASFENPWEDVEMGAEDEEILRQLQDGGYGQDYQLLAQGCWKEVGDYETQHEADWAMFYKLAWLTNNDGGRMYAIFKETDLMRDESEKHPSYYPRTISAIIDSRNGTAGDQGKDAAAGEAKERWPDLRLVTDDGAGRDEQDSINTGEPGEGQESSSDAARDDNCETAAETVSTKFNCTDQGNGQRLVARHGQDLHYVYVWNRWLIWDGRHWVVDETGEVQRRAKDTARSIYAEVKNITDETARKDLVKHALQSENEARRRNMITSAQSEPGVPVTPQEFDQDFWLLNCLNGTIDLHTGELQPHRRADLLTKICPVEFKFGANCPAWSAFLRRVLDEDKELISFVQKAVGYSMTGCTHEQVLFILHGLGGNGKSTFLESIKGLQGNYATQTPSETFLVKSRGGQIPNDLAALRGSRLVATVEVDAGRHLSEALIKQVTGGDEISARFLYGNWFTYKPQFKLWMGTNHKPVIRGQEHAIWRRIRLIPFTVQIPEMEQDQTLGDKLFLELPGILNWALEGCRLWQAEGLTAPAAVQAATQEYREDMDVLADFLAECCIIDPSLSVPAGELYAAYGQWASAHGEKEPLSKRAFNSELDIRNFKRKRTNTKHLRLGLNLRAEQ